MSVFSHTSPTPLLGDTLLYIIIQLIFYVLFHRFYATEFEETGLDLKSNISKSGQLNSKVGTSFLNFEIGRMDSRIRTLEGLVMDPGKTVST